MKLYTHQPLLCILFSPIVPFIPVVSSFKYNPALSYLNDIGTSSNRAGRIKSYPTSEGEAIFIDITRGPAFVVNFFHVHLTEPEVELLRHPSAKHVASMLFVMHRSGPGRPLQHTKCGRHLQSDVWSHQVNRGPRKQTVPVSSSDVSMENVWRCFVRMRGYAGAIALENQIYPHNLFNGYMVLCHPVLWFLFHNSNKNSCFLVFMPDKFVIGLEKRDSAQIQPGRQTRKTVDRDNSLSTIVRSKTVVFLTYLGLSIHHTHANISSCQVVFSTYRSIFNACEYYLL